MYPQITIFFFPVYYYHHRIAYRGLLPPDKQHFSFIVILCPSAMQALFFNLSKVAMCERCKSSPKLCNVYIYI